MATSRDDFVIAIRSAFLKKGNKQRFSLIVLIFFSLILIFLGRFNFIALNYLKISLNEIVYRSSFIVSVPEKQLIKIINLSKEHFFMYEDYKDTKKKIKELESARYQSDFIIAENKRLKLLIDKYDYNSDELMAKVLLDKESPFLKSIIINKGSKDKVKIGMAVLDGNYLVGKVVEVNYSTSRVLLISDLNSKIPVVIEPQNIQSILSGTGRIYGEIQYFDGAVPVQENGIIYTSGSGGIFKEGIPVGNLDVNIGTKENVKFFSNLSQLNFVKLLSFKRED